MSILNILRKRARCLRCIGNLFPIRTHVPYAAGTASKELRPGAAILSSRSTLATPLAICIAILVLTAIPAWCAPPLQPPVTRTVMPNGLCVLFKPEQGSGLVAIEAFVKAGAAQERDAKAGIGNLVVRALLSSTRNRSQDRLSAAFDEVGGAFRTDWYPDFAQISAITTTSHFDDAVNIMADVLQNAEFDPAVVKKVQEDTLAEMRGGGDNVHETVYTQLLENLYTDSPYRRPKTGYNANVRGITRDDMLAFYKSYYVPNNIVVSVVGDLTEEQVLERFRKAFAGTTSSPLPPQRRVGDESVVKPVTRVSERDTPAAYLVVGYLAPGVTNPDFPAATVLNAVLGGGKASRLFTNLRDKQGIGYEIGATYPILKHQSHIMAMLVTSLYKPLVPGSLPEMALQDAKSAINSEIDSLKEKPISDEELLRAKRFAIGSFALRHERLRERAFFLGWMEAIDAGYKFDTDFASKIEAVTKADVQKTAQKYFTNSATIVALPKSAPLDLPSRFGGTPSAPIRDDGPAR